MLVAAAAEIKPHPIHLDSTGAKIYLRLEHVVEVVAVVAALLRTFEKAPISKNTLFCEKYLEPIWEHVRKKVRLKRELN